VLIPSLYATSPRTRSLRPVRVPSDQNTRWRLPFLFSINKRQEFLVSPHLPHKIDFEGGCFRRDAAHMRHCWWSVNSCYFPGCCPVNPFSSASCCGVYLPFWLLWSPTSNVAGAQPTPPPLPPAEKIPSPPLVTSTTPSSLPPGCCESPPSAVAGTPLSPPGSNKWRDLFSTRSTVSYTRLQHFSLNHLSKTCVVSSEDIQPAFDVWKYCVVG